MQKRVLAKKLQHSSFHRRIELDSVESTSLAQKS